LYKEQANPGYIGNYSPKTNVIIEDIFPTDLKWASVSTFNFIAFLRGPIVSTVDGLIHQSNVDVHAVQFGNVARIPQQAGQSYADFKATVVGAQAPCYGIYDNVAVIVNLGDLPSSESFLDMYNRLHGESYTSMEDYLKANLTDNATIGMTGLQRAENWLSTRVYTDTMPVMDFTIQFFGEIDWHATDLDASEKFITNKATMTWNGSESMEQSVDIRYSRIQATIQLTPGELYLLKADAETQTSIPNVKVRIHEYTGSATNIAGVRADTTPGVWGTGIEMITNSDGIARHIGNTSKFYKIVEVETATGYDLSSFELFDRLGTALADGVFEMPANDGIILVAENTKRTTAPVDVSLLVTKALTGRGLVAGEFVFKVYDENGIEVATATNAVDGNVVFGPISHSVEGTYVYTIKELVGTINGVTYDTKEIEATVVVTKNASGVLQTAVTYPISGSTFENTYNAPTGSIQLEATKALTKQC